MNKSKISISSGRNRKKSAKTKEDIICSQLKPDILLNSPFEEYQHAQGLFEDENDVEGKDIFQFRGTPKANRKSFLEKFETNLSLSTPKSRKSGAKQSLSSKLKMEEVTPKSSEKTDELQTRSLRLKRKQGLFEEEKDVEEDTFPVRGTPKANRKSFLDKFETNLSLSTPKSKKSGAKQSLSSKLKMEEVTPKSSEKTDERQTRSFRLKMKQELAGLKSASIDSDPEDSDNASDEDAYETDSQSDEEISSAVSDTKGKKNKKPSFSEAYFTAQKQKGYATSNKTLSNMKLTQTSIAELADILENVPTNHKKERETLFKKYCSQFRYWNSLLEAGFNVLLYGVGSKLKVLKQFCKDNLEEALYVVLYGFFPSLTLKQILCTITEDALEHDGKFSNVQDHYKFIKDYFLECKEELYIIIHNIDGMALRSVKTQSMLSILASIPNIHFICSIDHINAALLWDQIMMSHFKWVWFDTTTFEPYILETSYENSIFRDQSSHLLLSSLLHVYNSLTPNSRGVFLILAKHQKEEQSKSTNSGISFHEWYQECREAFLVNSEITMQAQLSEFKNHKLLTSRKNSDGIELWYIPVDMATLDQFLESSE